MKLAWWSTVLWCVAACGYALPQQSLLLTVTQDTSPQQSLLNQYTDPAPDNRTAEQTFFDNYKNPHASHYSFETPAGLYRQLCTSCVYDTTTVQCLCQDKDGKDPVKTHLVVNDCQQITVDQNGQLMCLDSLQGKKA